MYRTVVEAVLAHEKSQPDHLAVAFKKERLSYSQLAAQVRGTAYVLRKEYGIEKDDRVLMIAASTPEYIIAFLAVQYLGAVSVPVDKSIRDGRAGVYQYIEPKLVLVTNKAMQAFENSYLLKDICRQGSENSADFPYEAPEDDHCAEIILTTGTTGTPKGGMLSIGNVRAGTCNTCEGVGMRADDIVLSPLPLNHSFAMRVVRAVFWLGASLVLQNGFTFVKEIENNLDLYQCTGLISTPASMELIYRQMQEHFADIMGRFRYIEVGAGSLNYDMREKLLKVLPDTKIVNTWGSTETGGAIFLKLPEHADKLSALGKPADNVKVKAVDEFGHTKLADCIENAGRMALCGPMCMMGYYRMPELTAETLADGWLLTNDLIHMDADGFIYMHGRADDIINVGGKKVSPIEVENVAQTYDGIRECACIGVDDPDQILGQVPVLFAVLEGNEFDEKLFQKFMASKLEKEKIPARWMIVDKLPRNRMDKLDRKALRTMWEHADAAPEINAVVSNILSRRSIREFTEQPISGELLEILVKCGYYAPTGHNLQTWRFTVIQDQEKMIRLKETVSRVTKEQNAIFYGFQNPKALILISNDRRNKNGIQDSSCAAENIMLAAHSYGIGSVWINAMMEICDVPEIRDMLHEYEIPGNHIVWSMIALGYPKEAGKLLAKKTDVVRWF